jgi:photoprotection regulator FRP-like protein
MVSVHSSAVDYGIPNAHEPKWSPSEKSVARKIYEGALQRELDAIMREAKQRAQAIRAPGELWDLEDYLTESRKEINRKYDYRYSVLPLLFAQLVREGRITEEDLRGLSENKLNYVRLVRHLEKEKAEG